ncbi:hypothetical protein PHMEG_0004023 [Phytophthora megakarya]|uniref:Uncharacterized protein n=1 Tax=Phytophthora megakarya TaxID=4795 RepID=A0A225WUU1_9STRA|nr:hypothetical protein PHMEG_0004023 [Phytophthora megakarya]
MQRLLLVLIVSMAIVVDSDASWSLAVENEGGSMEDNTTVVQPGADGIPNSGSGNAAAKVKVVPSDGNGGGLSSVAVAIIVLVSVVGLGLGVTMVVCAWRTTRLEEEAMFMDIDLGDERSYTYGRFGDYAAM